MANETSKKEEISKAIDALVDEQLGKETPAAAKAEAAEKAMPASQDENGGKDKMHSGSPYSDKQSAGEADKKKKEVKKSEDESEEDEVEKAKAEKKDEDCDDDKKMDLKKKGMKKSHDLGDLADDEVELVKAWREEKSREAEEITKARPALDAEVLTKAVSDAINKAVDPLKKALEAKDGKIEELEKSIKKLASQPAYDKRSLSSLEPIEKGGSEEQTITKSKVTDKMLELQMQGKGVRSNHIAEFEATGNISDPGIKKLVMEQFK